MGDDYVAIGAFSAEEMALLGPKMMEASEALLHVARYDRKMQYRTTAVSNSPVKFSVY